MTSKRHLHRSARLALATVVAGGMAAAPIAVTTGLGVVSNDAHAAMTPAGTQQTGPQKTMSTTANARAPEAIGGDLAGYRPATSDNMVALTRKPIDNMVNLTLNDGLEAKPVVSDQQVAKATSDEMAMAKNPMPRQQMSKSGMTQGMMGSSSTMGTQSALTSFAPKDRHAQELRRYAQAMNAGDLDAAASALAQSTNDVIDKNLVLQMNADLGVTSTLNAQQVAQVAAAKQAVRFAEGAREFS